MEIGGTRNEKSIHTAVGPEAAKRLRGASQVVFLRERERRWEKGEGGAGKVEIHNPSYHVSGRGGGGTGSDEKKKKKTKKKKHPEQKTKKAKLTNYSK